MTPISDERADTLRCAANNYSFVSVDKDDLLALLAEREAAGKVQERIRLADVQLANWQWNIEHNEGVEPKRDEQLRCLESIRQALKGTT